MKNLWFPVTKKDRERMKEGKEILKHFHDVVYPEDTLAVVVGKPFDRSKYNYLLARGIDIVPIELTDTQIDNLDFEAIGTLSRDPRHKVPVTVHVVDQDEFEKAKKEAEKRK